MRARADSAGSFRGVLLRRARSAGDPPPGRPAEVRGEARQRPGRGSTRRCDRRRARRREARRLPPPSPRRVERAPGRATATTPRERAPRSPDRPGARLRRRRARASRARRVSRRRRSRCRRRTTRTRRSTTEPVAQLTDRGGEAVGDRHLEQGVRGMRREGVEQVGARERVDDRAVAARRLPLETPLAARRMACVDERDDLLAEIGAVQPDALRVDPLRAADGRPAVDEDDDRRGASASISSGYDRSNGSRLNQDPAERMCACRTYTVG